MIDITEHKNLWQDCFMVHSLVMIGSREEDGAYNFAPKHLAMPMGFSRHFGFMGTPRKSTYQNVKREGVFTVSYPRPEQLIISSLSASMREEDYTKPVIDQIPSVPARLVDGRLLEDAYLQLECRLTQILGDFEEWRLLVGEVVAAYIHDEAYRKYGEDGDDGELIHRSPLLAYLHPNRFTEISDSRSFPLPKNFER